MCTIIFWAGLSFVFGVSGGAVAGTAIVVAGAVVRANGGW